MSFLNPALLAFTTAIAVPILIHLLNRRRFRRVSWAAMRFVQLSLDKNRRRMRFEDLLLLVLRCLVVGLLAFALARPALRSAAAFLDTSRPTAVVVLDHSASLGAGDGTVTRFELARQAAEAAVEAFPAGSPLAVLLAGDPVSAPLAEPSFDLNLVRKTVREAPLSDLGTDHSRAIAAAVSLLRSQTALQKEIVLVTDRQAVGWRRLPEIASALADAGRDTRLRVVFVGDPVEDNLAVANLTRSAGFASAREPLRFDAEIANRGATAVRQVRATLHLDGGPAVDEATLERLSPGETRPVTFFAKLPEDGFHAVSVRLPADRFPADDERTMVVRAVKAVRVLVVDGDPGSNAAFFLRHALQPVPPEATRDYYLQPEVIPPGQLGLTRLSDFDAVILADIPPLPAAAVDALARHVRDGGALLIFPGPQAKPAFYNADLNVRAGLLPATLGAIRGDPASDETRLTLQTTAFDHPVFALWNEAGAGSLAAVRFRAAWELLPVPAPTNAAAAATSGSGARIMVRFSDGTPAAVERSVGQGRVMLFASPAGTAWNDLAVRPAFVPLLHRAVGSLANAKEGAFNVRTGDPVTLHEPSEWIGRDVAVVTPGNPERRLTRTLRAAPGGAALEFDETLQAGAYRAYLPGVSAPVAMFAARPDPEESDATDITSERRAEIERLGQVIDWTPAMDLRAAFDRERVGVELWLPLALAVLLLAVAEAWLAQRFSRSWTGGAK